MPHPQKLVIFDLDGTLNRTELFSVGAHRMVQTEFGWTAQSPEQIKRIYGLPAKEYISMLLPGADKETQDRYLKRVDQVEQECMDLAEAYQGCSELMDRLHEDGCATAVCSNAPAHYIEKVLDKIHLADKVDYTQPLEKNMNSKTESLRALIERVQPEQGAVMVGDTSMDSKAASDNGIPFVGCLYGYRPEEMQTEKYHVSEPREIAGMVREILG